MKKALIAGALYALPFVALAQQTDLITGIATVGKIINTVVLIVSALLLIYFFWGIAQYISAGGDEEKRGQARNMMIYAVIGMFVAFSVFGLVRLLGRTFGVDSDDTAKLPLISNMFDFGTPGQ